MLRHPRLLLIGLCTGALLVACGGDPATGPEGPAAAPRPPPGSMPEGERAPGELHLSVGDRELATDGRVRVSSFTPAADRIDLTLKGPVAGVASTATTDADVWFVILTDTLEPATVPLVWSTNQIHDQDGAQGYVKVSASSAVDLGELFPKSGTLTIDRVALAGGSSEVVRLSGSFEGTFFDRDDEEVTASGRFDVAR